MHIIDNSETWGIFLHNTTGMVLLNTMPCDNLFFSVTKPSY